MGTNFYLNKYEGAHIGKSSAAGPYCWKCRVSFAKDVSKLHFDSAWHNRCPGCNSRQEKQSLSDSAGGMQLGFNKSASLDNGRVGSANSFSWASAPEEIQGLCSESGDDAVITNEYGKVYTGAEFLAYLKNVAPIHLTDSIGKDFS